MPKGMTKKQMGGVPNRHHGIRGKSKESAYLNQKYKNLTNDKSCTESTINELLKLYSINSEKPGLNNKIINYIINCLENKVYSADLLNAISERIVSTEGMVFNNNESVRNDTAIYASVRRKSPIDKKNLKKELQRMISLLSGVKNNALSSSHSSLRRTSSSHTPSSSRRSSQSKQYASIGGARKYRSKKANKNKRCKVCKTKKLRGGMYNNILYLPPQNFYDEFKEIKGDIDTDIFKEGFDRIMEYVNNKMNSIIKHSNIGYFYNTTLNTKIVLNNLKTISEFDYGDEGKNNKMADEYSKMITNIKTIINHRISKIRSANINRQIKTTFDFILNK